MDSAFECIKKNQHKNKLHIAGTVPHFSEEVLKIRFKKKIILTWSIFQESKNLSASSASFSFHKLLSAAFREDYSRSSWRIALQCQSLIIKIGTKETWRKGDNLHFSVGNFMGLVCVKCSKILVLRESKALSKKNTSPRPANLWATAAAENQWHIGDKMISTVRNWEVERKAVLPPFYKKKTGDQRDQKAFPKLTHKS